VLKWIFERCEGTAKAQESPIGLLPAPGDLDVRGLDAEQDDLAELLSVDVEGWLEEIPLIRAHYARFGERMPRELLAELDGLEKRLRASR
jgi:phosphoenolpyruvate carboxykinase (GTP)